MTLVTDRDLLRIDPDLFSDAVTVATLLLDADDGSIAATSLSSASSDFVASEIDSGHVVVIDGSAFEVVARLSATELTISRPRADDEEPTIPPSDGTGLSFSIPTFARRLELARAWIHGSLGLDGSDPGCPLVDTAVLNPRTLRRLIALEAAAGIYNAAAAQAPDEDSLAARAAHYAAERSRARATTRILLDLDGDGLAEASCGIGIVSLRRI